MIRLELLIALCALVACGDDGGSGRAVTGGEGSTGGFDTTNEADSTAALGDSGSSGSSGGAADESSSGASTGEPGSDASTGSGGAPGGCVDPQPLTCDGTDVLLEGGSWVVNESCSIGALTVQGDACLAVPLPESATFEVAGDLTVAGEASLVIDGGTLRIANPSSEAYTLTLHDSATMTISNLEVVTQDGSFSDSIYMRAHTYDEAAFAAGNVVLDEQTSWLLFDAHDDSTVALTDPEHIPTELYVYDRSRVEMVGGHIGLWLNFAAGASSVVLPDQTSGPYDWVVDANSGSAAEWSVSIEDAQPGLGINAWPGSDVTVQGVGAPQTGELTFGYFASGTETLSGLEVGLVEQVSVGGRVHLDNVHLGPIAWQVYALEGEDITIEDSTVNELGIVGAANVTVRNSTLQLALLTVLADDATLTVEDSQIWNQLVQASGSASVVLDNCDIHGSELQAATRDATISVLGGAFHDNPQECSVESMVDIETGQPNCNPFNVPGPPTPTGPGTVTCEGTTGCRF